MVEDLFSEYDKKIMRLAIRLAGKANGLTSPNPMVGAVIVSDGKVLSSGYHKKAGGPHAEVEAISACMDSRMLEGARLYVTLEPCSIHGRTPPCTDAIIKNRFSEVIIGSRDPNPKISGRGIEKLKRAGIKVSTGLLNDEIERQNEVFFKHIVTASPFITLKVASSIDGRIAAKSGDSKWITSPKSRRLVQKIRKSHDCILTGINTVLNDDPFLYPRKKSSLFPDLDKGKRFYRAILDARLKISPDSNIAKTAGQVSTIVFMSQHVSPGKKKVSMLRELGIDVVAVPSEKVRDGLVRLDIPVILKKLYRGYGITSIMIEAGPTLSTEFLKKALIDKFIFFIAPKIIGGDNFYSMFSGLDIARMQEAIRLSIVSKKHSGDDILITAYPAM